MPSTPSEFRDTPPPHSPRRAIVLSLDPATAVRVQRILDHSDGLRFVVQTVAETGAVLEILRTESAHALLIDLRGREADRLQPVVQTREVMARLPIIVLSDRDDSMEALQALRLGAQDYLVDGLEDPPALRRSL